MLNKIKNTLYALLLLVCGGVYTQEKDDAMYIFLFFWGGLFCIWVTFFVLRLTIKKGKEINDKYKSNSIDKRKEEEKIYSKIYSEIQSNELKEGLMAKALAKSHGNKQKAEALYVQFRFQSLKDDKTLN